jgi:hypothetical protein
MTYASEQLRLDLPEPWVRPPIGDAPAAPEHGEVFTRRWIVDLILDLAGYTADRDLGSFVAVEPACGAGAFLVPMVERLLTSAALHGRAVTELEAAIRARDLLPANVVTADAAIEAALTRLGLTTEVAAELAQCWVKQGDFLLEDHKPESADFVLGNPPYIRLENVSPSRSAAYRDVCSTMRGRSDVFVGFIELGLRQLRGDGVLGFIVADRWMRNQYGSSLRAMISDGFAVEAVIQLHDVDAFEQVVSAYPAITVIRRGPQRDAIIAETTSAFDEGTAATTGAWVHQGHDARLDTAGVSAARLPGWFDGDRSWPAGSPDHLAMIASLEARFPPLENPRTKTRVGIGVASGLDSVYLTRDTKLVEPDRLLPMVMAKDTVGGSVSWTGTHLVNPWRNGDLVRLEDYPRLRAHLEAHADAVRARHVARRNPPSWYRTIDRVEPGLRERPKLLLPDLKAAIHPVLDDGHYYPHHNLYFVTSEGWDPEVLGGLLLSDVANLFVGTYCVKMRGGYYRFQAQYLRRIRVPEIASIKPADKRALSRAFSHRDVEAATSVACRLYGIDGLPVTVRAMRTISA